MSKEILGDATDFLRGFSDLNEDDDYERVSEYYTDDDEHEFGCCFPGECLHPSYDHLRSECFTAEMAEAWAADEMNAKE